MSVERRICAFCCGDSGDTIVIGSSGEVHYLTFPRPNGLHWDGMFYWNASIKKGTVYAFRPNSERPRQVVYLQGLEPAKHYRVRGEDGSVADSVLSGAVLMNEGIVLQLPRKFSSDIIYVEEVA